jgi:cell division protein FtsQ
MKKTGAKRVSGYDSGLGSAVLTAPEDSYASEGEGRAKRRGPAPAGAYQRGFGGDRYESGADSSYTDESEYVPQRGKLGARFRSLPRSVAGRIVLGVVAFALLAAVAVAVAGVRSYLMHDARFVLASSDDIQITGAEHLTREQIVTVFGADLERNIFRVSLAERQEDLERLPWVAHATVMRLLPNVLRVQITERTPVAFVRQGSQIGLVDASGVLLDMPADAAGDPHYSFPVLTGLSADEAMSERTTKMEVYEQFLHELDGSGQHLTNSVSEVDVADPEDVKALITSGSSDILVHFGQEQFLKRYQEFEQHLEEWKQQYPKLASADMRYEGQIVLEMQGDGKTAAISTGAVEAGSVASPAPVIAKPVTETKAVASAKPAAVKTTASKAVVAKPVLSAAASKPAVPKPGMANGAASKPAVPKARAASVDAPKPVVLSASGSKPAAPKPDFSNAMPKPAAPKPVMLNGTAANAATPKPAAPKASAAPKTVAAKKVVAKPVAGKAKPGSGMSAANAKVFARLAAEHKAELAKEQQAKEHKAGTSKVAKNGSGASKSGAGSVATKSGATP